MESRTRFAALVTLAFLVIAGIGIARHEMWRDELQAWMLAADSRSPAELLHNMRYEGHPALWHLLLWGISRWTRNPEAMQVLHLGIAAASVFLFARWAPFPPRVRALFAFGYFPLYEYGVVSRNYALGLLLVLAFCALYPARFRRLLPLGAVLALLANSNPYAWILAVVLAATLVYEGVASEGLRRAVAARPWDAALAALVFGAGAAVAAIQMIPPPDGGYATSWWLRLGAEEAYMTLATLVHAYLPLPDAGDYAAWNTSFLWSFSYWISALAALVLVALAVRLLRGARPAVFLYAAGTAALLGFTYFKYFGSLRHHGHHFVLLTACLWLAGEGGEERARSRREAWLTGLLLVHLIGAVTLYALDLALPFSAAKATAEFIARQGLAGMPIAGKQDYGASPVGGYLQRALYYPNSGKTGTFILWNRERVERLPEEAYCRRLQDQVGRHPGGVLLVSTGPLPACPAVRSALLARFPLSMVADERYSVFLLRRGIHPA
ncbi:MAG TPA: hypothetical protein VF756_24805 [Thermoanaerobaculia bacterium]